MGAVIITTDAPPMSDIVDASFGFRVPVSSETRHHSAPQYHVSAQDIADAVDLAIANEQHWSLWGHRARAAYLQGHKDFHDNITKFIADHQNDVPIIHQPHVTET